MTLPTKRRAKTAVQPAPRRSFSKKPPDIRRQELIDATFRCLCRLGPAETSVRTIAEEAGLSLGMVRHHFNSKDELLAAGYRALSAQLQAQTARALEQAGPEPAAQLRALTTAGLHPPILDREYIQLRFLFWGLSQTNAAVREVHDEIYSRFAQQLNALLRSVARSSKARIDADGLTLTIMALLKGLWLEWSLAPAGTRMRPDRLAEQALTPLLSWIKTPAQ